MRQGVRFGRSPRGTALLGIAPSALVASIAATLLWSGCADDPSNAPEDTTPPAAVIDLRILEQTPRSVTLAWTSPDEDGPEGRAQRYDLRYLLDSIDEESWDLGLMVLAPVPQPPGNAEVVRVSPLVPGATYGFALRSEDLAGNVSELSNVVTVTLENPGLREGVRSGPGESP